MSDYGLKLKMSTLIAALVIKPEMALTAVPVILQNTEALLTKLADADKHIVLSYMSAASTEAKIFNFSQYRK